MVRVIATDRIEGRNENMGMVNVGTVTTLPLLPSPTGIIPADVVAHEAVSVANAAMYTQVSQLLPVQLDTPADDEYVNFNILRDEGKFYSSQDLTLPFKYNGTTLFTLTGHIQRVSDVVYFVWEPCTFVGTGTIAIATLPTTSQKMWIRRGETCSGTMGVFDSFGRRYDARMTLFQEFYIALYKEYDVAPFDNGETFNVAAGMFAYPCFV
jgi:hypothetical protein